MSDNTALFMAILSLDAYNRGYGPGFDIPNVTINGTQIGTAQFVIPASDPSTSFYAAEYKLDNGKIVIAYRGTRFPGKPDWGDVSNGWTLSSGYSPASQAQEALTFYNQVKAASPSATIITTGHSLGGGLAAFVADVDHLTAYAYNNIPFGGAMSDFIPSIRQSGTSAS
jgi:hypothetical protein